jgi:predicted ferric reductase
VRLNPNVWWYVARASGVVAWVLLAATVFWGLIFAGRLTRKVPPPAWNLDLHRFLGGLSVIFVAVHIAGLASDKYVNFGLSQIFVPFGSSWRPGAVAWGITALYVLVAIEATSLAMRWLPRRVWRAVHLLSFLLFVFATVHAIQAGTDATNVVVRVVGLGLIATAVVTAALRIVQAQNRRPARRPGTTAPESP